MSSERPAKRIRQACEPCRRKKSRCPGEKPVCSHCARLRQNCYYAEDRQERQESERTARSISPTPAAVRRSEVGGNGNGNGNRRGSSVLEERLRHVESQLAEVLAMKNRLGAGEVRDVGERIDRGSPVREAESGGERGGISHPRPVSQGEHGEIELPHWDEIFAAAETYLMYCDCQPLPLFHKPSFIETLKDRQPEILFAILALAGRFDDGREWNNGRSRQDRDARYLTQARNVITRKINDGAVELSTIQTLSLIALIDFSEGQTRRASIHTSLGMSLAHNAGLTSETILRLPESEKEERRRCFWSLFLLKRLHGADFMILDFAAEDNFPWYPATTSNPTHHTPHAHINHDPDVLADKGIVAYAIQLSEVWFKITRYAWRRGKPSAVPPWSAQSEYHTILAQQMDFETRMPFKHRFEPAKFSQQTIEHLNSNRDYWGPWLFIQFLYHTNLCLLTHPLLISLRLKNFKCVIPEIFLQHTSDLISSHASWIINFIDMLEAKNFKVTDPFLGHCVVIVATIYLQESFVDDEARRLIKQECFGKCLRFIRGLGSQWRHMGGIADKLQRLAETVSSTYVASEEPTRQNRKLLIDLGQFFEVLEYSSSSELPGSARKLFGPSLYTTTANSRREIAQTSVLPEPTRVERQEFGSTPAGTAQGTPVANSGVMMDGANNMMTGGSLGSDTPFGQMMNYSDDELAVLAESFFFHGQEGMGGNHAGGGAGGGNWWNAR